MEQELKGQREVGEYLLKKRLSLFYHSCNLCEKKFRRKNSFQRFCHTCKIENTEYSDNVMLFAIDRSVSYGDATA